MTTADDYEISDALNGWTDAVLVIGVRDEQGSAIIAESIPYEPSITIDIAIAQAWRRTDGRP